VVVTDVNDYRLSLAQRMGATHIVNVQRGTLADAMKAQDIREGFDIGLEMSGNPKAFNDMLLHMYHGGRVALLGILPKDTRIDWDQVIFKGLVIKGIYGREMFETWYKMSSMLQSGLDITPVITHHLPSREFRQAFETLKHGESGKIILDWSD